MERKYLDVTKQFKWKGFYYWKVVFKCSVSNFERGN